MGVSKICYGSMTNYLHLTDTSIWHFETKILMRGCGSGKIVESLFALQDGGVCLYGMSADGYFYYSYNEGADWERNS